MILAQAHVSFTVSDIERSKEFYGDLLGLPLAYEMVHRHLYTSVQVGYADAHLLAAGFYIGSRDGDGAAVLELLEYVNPKGGRVDMETANTGIAHLAMYVDDIWAEYNRLRGRGVTFRSAPVLVEEGVNVGVRTVYLRDPDDVTLELVERPGLV